MRHRVLSLSLLLTSCLFQYEAIAMDTIDLSPIDEAKRTVVSIKIRQNNSAYNHPESSYGTGFVIDIKRGIIATNRHIASVDAVARYEAYFFNGKTADLKFVWNDPHHDFAFLKVGPKDLPEGIPQLSFTDAKTGDNISIIGNNGGVSYSIQTGTITDLFDSTSTIGSAPQHALTMSVNTVGGSSGSPVFNKRYEIIGLNFGGSQTSKFAVPISYVTDALNYIKEEKHPPRYSTGVFMDLLALDHAKDYYGFEDTGIEKYITDTPDSRSRILQVATVLPNPAVSNPLQVGDIIKSVEGKEAYYDSYAFEKVVNASNGEPVKVVVSREGTELSLDVPTIDLNALEGSKFISFANSIFAPVNLHKSFSTGMPIGRVCMSYYPSGTLFCELENLHGEDYPFLLTKILGQPIQSLKDVESLIPLVTEKKKITYEGCLHASRNYTCDQGPRSLFIRYDSSYYPAPEWVSFDFDKHEWVRKAIDVEGLSSSRSE